MPRSLADESSHANRKIGGLLAGLSRPRKHGWQPGLPRPLSFCHTSPVRDPSARRQEWGAKKIAPEPAPHTDCAKGGVASPGAKWGPTPQKAPRELKTL